MIKSKPEQISLGDNQKELGKKVWYTTHDGLFWVGHLYNRTPEQLKKETETTLRDLKKHFPELFDEKQPQSSFPRRACLEKMLPAEKTLFQAVMLIEELGCNIELTNIIVELSKIRDRISDYIDNNIIE